MVSNEQLNLFGISFWGEPGLLGVPALVKTGSSGRRGHCALFAACIVYTVEKEGASSLQRCVPTVCHGVLFIGLLEFCGYTDLKIPL